MQPSASRRRPGSRATPRIGSSTNYEALDVSMLRARAVARRPLGLRMADCGLGTRSFGLSNPQSAIRHPQVASLTIGRLHYDGGGDWYSGPSKLVNLLGAIRQRTRLAVGDRERVVTLTSP